MKNHTEEQLDSGTHVHSFNDKIAARNWVHSVQRRMIDGRIQNDENTKFILISGTHGAQDGRSVFSDWGLLEKEMIIRRRQRREQFPEAGQAVR